MTYQLGTDSDRIRLDSLNDCKNHLYPMLQQSRRLIRIFSQQLDTRLFDQQEVLTALKSCALNEEAFRVQVLVSNVSSFISKGHRLLDLSRQLSSYFELRETHKDYRDNLRQFVLCDKEGYVFQDSAERYEGEACFYNPLKVTELGKWFSDAWECSTRSPEFLRIHI